MTRVCVLLNNSFTSDSRVKREVFSLAKAGYDVTVICLISSNPDTPRREIQSGVHIHRVIKKYNRRNQVFSSRSLKAITRILSHYKPFDVIHAHDVYMLTIGWILSRVWCSRLIYDSHEYWSAIFQGDLDKIRQDTSNPSQSARLQKQIKACIAEEVRLLPKCDGLISVNDSILGFLRKKAPHGHFICRTIRNIPDPMALPETKTNLLHAEFNLPADTRILLYQGMLSDIRGIGQLVRMMSCLTMDRVALVMVGPILPDNADYSNRLLADIAQSPTLSQRVFYKPSVPHEVLLQLAASADLGLTAILNCHDNHYYCLPNKIFEYIQAGLPVGVSNFPEMANLVETYGVGFTFDPENPQEMADKIQAFLSSPDQQATTRNNVLQARQTLHWKNEEQHLLSLYRDLNLLPEKSNAPKPMPSSGLLSWLRAFPEFALYCRWLFT